MFGKQHMHALVRLSARIQAILAAVLLAGAVGACAIELEGPDNHEAEAQQVSFALALKMSGGEVATKMTQVVTQATGSNNSFRGIEQVYAIPFSGNVVSSGSARLGGQNIGIQNPGILGSFGAAANSGLVNNNNAHLFDFVKMPSGMQSVLVYGKAPDDGSASTIAGKHHNGVLTPTALESLTTPADISFSLESIVADNSAQTTLLSTADALIAALNGVVSNLAAAVANMAADPNADPTTLATYQTAYDNFIHKGNQTLQNGEAILACSASTVSAMITQLESDLGSGNTVTGLADLKTAVTSGTYAGFPSSTDGIPEGAIGMTWNGTSFVRLINNVNISLVSLQAYSYPPSLWYYVNSPIQTSSDDNIKEKYIEANATWWNGSSGIVDQFYTAGGTVQSATRSAAVVNQLQYGVGMLRLKLGTASAGAGCPLKGVILDDQKDVDFSFTPKSSGASRVVYDNEIPAGVTIVASGNSVEVPTLVLQSEANKKIHFALEFQNTGAPFDCIQGKVLSGASFYLVGELDPNATSGVTQPSGETLSSVFVQDHNTQVTVVINSLTNAYTVVPDLRDPQLEIGVIAELNWYQSTPNEVELH